MAKKKYAPPTPWEIAKPLLEEDILTNQATLAMSLREVVLLWQEYKKVEYMNFSSNLWSLHKKLLTMGNYANADNLALRNDRQLNPIDMENPHIAYLPWDSHPAQRWLWIDVNNQAQLGVTPKAFQETRDEYKAFPLDIFCKHIQQAVNDRVESSYWLEWKAKKVAKKGAAAASGRKNDDEAD